MARLILAAHDPGGGNALAAVVEPLRARGHAVRLVAAGPAAASWRANGWRVDGDVAPADLLVSATGMGRYEQQAWERARELGLASVGMVEAWTNVARRFTRPDGTATRPDAALVAEEPCRRELIEAGWAPDRVMVVGQPHLEQVGQAVREARRGREPGRPPVLAFVSEPIIEDFADGCRRFDQYQVFRALVKALDGRGPVRLLLCPHPREEAQGWDETCAALDIPDGVRLDRSPAGGAALLGTVDAVIGMTSSMIVEAALGGIPVLSLQPGRGEDGIGANPVIDRLMPVTATWEDVPRAVARLLADPSRAIVPEWLGNVTKGATMRFIAALELLLTTKC